MLSIFRLSVFLPLISFHFILPRRLLDSNSGVEFRVKRAPFYRTLNAKRLLLASRLCHAPLALLAAPPENYFFSYLR